MNENVNILVVDDDVNIGHLIKLYLEKEGFSVSISLRGDEAVQTFKNGSFQLIILDIMLPGIDGWDVCREVRKVSDVPIIMLTAKGETFDKVLGLELGADDYLPKPFEVLELLARVEALLRRARPDENNRGNQAFTFGNIRVNRNEAEVVRDGEQLELSGKEFNLLLFLLENRNTVFSRDELLEHVWGYHDMPCTRTVDMHIANLRSKLERNPKHPKYIITVHGLGYKFTG